MSAMINIHPVKPTCVLLIGPPCSGKSTYREEIIEQMSRLGRVPIIISSDDYIEDLARELGVTYSQAFGKADFKAINRDISKTLGDAIADRREIIHDRTNMTLKSRNKVLARLSKDYQRIAVDFQIPRDVLEMRLEERAAKTGKSISAVIVDDMISTYQPPELGEFDEIIRKSYP